MSIAELADLGEFVSGVAVVVSLLYLALQMRQNAKHTTALIHQGRAAQGAERLAMIAADPALTDIVIRAQVGDTTLQDTDIARYVFLMFAALANFEDQFFQHRQGLLTDDDFEYTVLAVKAVAFHPGFRSTWQLAKGRYARSFQDFIDGLIAASPPRAPAPFPAAWRTFSAQELAKIPTSPSAPA